MKKPRIILFFSAICLFFTFQGSLFGEKWKLDDLTSLFNALKRPAGAAPAGTFDFPSGGAIMALWWEVTLPRVVSANDENGNGLSDTLDFIEGGRLEAERRPVYKSAYYRGGYPPDEEGVCTDVIWRAFKQAGYDLKKMIDDDIRANTRAYPRTGGKPDPHIDFRRVPNQKVFFQRHGLSLTTEIIPGDAANLAQWQPGDVVTFTNPDHIAILSDKRNGQGIPYLLHNQGPYATEGNDFMYWYERGITGHFRFPRK